jgi:manganese transport protein
MLPACVVVGFGVNAAGALGISQVMLSIALLFPMIALVMFTPRRDFMGSFTNRKLTSFMAIIVTVVVLLG